MREVLHDLHYHRTLAAFDVEKAFHAQEIRRAQRDQHVQRARKHRPRHRAFVGVDEAADTVGVLGFREETVTQSGDGLDEFLRRKRAVGCDVDLRARIEHAQLRMRAPRFVRPLDRFC